MRVEADGLGQVEQFYDIDSSLTCFDAGDK
jgi:hypothetical protein